MTREEILTDVIELARRLLADDRIPVSQYTFKASHHVRADSDEEGMAELGRIAEVLGVEVTESGGTHFYARKMFGSIEYMAVYIVTQEMADYSAFMATRPNVPTEERLAELEEETAEQDGHVDWCECEDCDDLVGSDG